MSRSDSLLDFEEENPDLIEQDVFSAVLKHEAAFNNLIGSQIGSYRIILDLGAGGRDAVFLAECADGTFEHQASLKLIKRRMDSNVIFRRYY